MILSYATDLADAIRRANLECGANCPVVSIERDANGRLCTIVTGPRNPIAIVTPDGQVKPIETRWTRLVDERKALMSERRSCAEWLDENDDVSLEGQITLQRAEQIDLLVAIIDGKLRGHSSGDRWIGMSVDEWLSHRAEILDQTESDVFRSCWPDLNPEKFCLSEDVPACLDAAQRSAAGEWLMEGVA